MTAECDVTIVVPTVGRESLRTLLISLEAAEGPLPAAVVVVDDRAPPQVPLADLLDSGERSADRLEIVASGGRGPAAARNHGWRRARTEWVAFLDDDVELPPSWLSELAADLAAAQGDVGAVQGGIVVSLPADRRPTDWERDVAGLERAQWATADMAYRVAALAEVDGLDERFRRAYREDADLGLRVVEAGWRITNGRRTVLHPVGTPHPWVSVRRQVGNADDALMRRLHGRGWRERAGVPTGRRPRHLAITSAGLAGIAMLAIPRPSTRRAGKVALLAWVVGSAELALSRIRPGPLTRREIALMAATSLVIPVAASWHWLRGRRRARRLAPDGPGPSPGQPVAARSAAVLFDRDGTLIVDRPCNAEPEKVELRPGAVEAVERVRQAGLPVGVVTNQSAVARGFITIADVDAVNDRIEDLLGEMDAWVLCTHEDREGCDCRKPSGGMVRQAAARLAVDPRDCVVIGDMGSDAEAAHAAGARAIMVPTSRTRPEETHLADAVAGDLIEGVELALGERRP